MLSLHVHVCALCAPGWQLAVNEEEVAKIMAQDCSEAAEIRRYRQKKSAKDDEAKAEKERRREWMDAHAESGHRMGTAEIIALYHSHAASQALGSTQTDGCQGDFCGVELELRDMEAQRVHIKGISEFRRKLLDLSDGADLAAAGGGGGAGEGGEKKKRLMTVPLRVIAQARKEATLVDMLLKRRRKGQVTSQASPRQTGRTNLVG